VNAAMVAIGSVELGARPRIVVPLLDTEIRTDTAHAKELADIFELRIDLFQRHEQSYTAQLCKAARVQKVPLIATVRSVEEGGGVTLDDDQRLGLFEAALPHVDALDIEHHAAIRDRVIEIGRDAGKRVLVSYHDFDRTPSERDLVGIVDEAKSAGAEIVKLATAATSFADVERLFTVLLSQRSKGLVAISLGAYGTVSRVVFPLFGSLLTYGFLHEAVAPGQLSVAELREEMRRYDPAFEKT
jgi:3-dehydroquinate dehydratase-1